jgi:hypothetical protein
VCEGRKGVLICEVVGAAKRRAASTTTARARFAHLLVAHRALYSTHTHIHLYNHNRPELRANELLEGARVVGAVSMVKVFCVCDLLFAAVWFLYRVIDSLSN